MNFLLDHCPFCNLKLSDKSNYVRLCSNCRFENLSKYEICLWSDSQISSVYFIVDHIEVQINYITFVCTRIIDRYGKDGNAELLKIDSIIDFDFSFIEVLKSKINLLLTFRQ